MKKILLLVHPKLSPENVKMTTGTEKDVWQALRRLGLTTQIVGVEDDLRAFDKVLSHFKPSIVVNLLEEFRGEAVYDFQPISFLEGLGIPYTGCNPRGLIQSRNKFVVGQLARSIGISTPRAELFTPGAKLRSPVGLEFPLFVKLNREHASLGIREHNRVRNFRELQNVVWRLRQNYKSEIIVQEFIQGRELSVAMWGNARAKVFLPRTLFIGGSQRVSTERLKFNLKAQRLRSLKSILFSGGAVNDLKSQARRLYELLDMSGYARFDYRLDNSGVPFLIDVNANPNLAKDEDFALSARAAGWKYFEVIEQILQLGLNYGPRF